MRSRKDGNGITRKLPCETVLYYKLFVAKGGEENQKHLTIRTMEKVSTTMCMSNSDYVGEKHK